MGYRREELTGRHVHILAHPEVREQVDTHIAQLLAGRVLKHNVKKPPQGWIDLFYGTERNEDHPTKR